MPKDVDQAGPAPGSAPPAATKPTATSVDQAAGDAPGYQKQQQQQQQQPARTGAAAAGPAAAAAASPPDDGDATRSGLVQSTGAAAADDGSEGAPAHPPGRTLVQGTLVAAQAAQGEGASAGQHPSPVPSTDAGKDAAPSGTSPASSTTPGTPPPLNDADWSANAAQQTPTDARCTSDNREAEERQPQPLRVTTPAPTPLPPATGATEKAPMATPAPTKAPSSGTGEDDCGGDNDCNRGMNTTADDQHTAEAEGAGSDTSSQNTASARVDAAPATAATNDTEPAPAPEQAQPETDPQPEPAPRRVAALPGGRGLWAAALAAGAVVAVLLACVLSPEVSGHVGGLMERMMGGAIPPVLVVSTDPNVLQQLHELSPEDSATINPPFAVLDFFESPVSGKSQFQIVSPSGQVLRVTTSAVNALSSVKTIYAIESGAATKLQRSPFGEVLYNQLFAGTRAFSQQLVVGLHGVSCATMVALLDRRFPDLDPKLSEDDCKDFVAERQRIFKLFASSTAADHLPPTLRANMEVADLSSSLAMGRAASSAGAAAMQWLSTMGNPAHRLQPVFVSSPMAAATASDRRSEDLTTTSGPAMRAPLSLADHNKAVHELRDELAESPLEAMRADRGVGVGIFALLTKIARSLGLLGPPSPTVVRGIHLDAFQAVFIGLPGSGKGTTAKYIAQYAGSPSSVVQAFMAKPSGSHVASYTQQYVVQRIRPGRDAAHREYHMTLGDTRGITHLDADYLGTVMQLVEGRVRRGCEIVWNADSRTVKADTGGGFFHGLGLLLFKWVVAMLGLLALISLTLIAFHAVNGFLIGAGVSRAAAKFWSQCCSLLLMVLVLYWLFRAPLSPEELEARRNYLENQHAGLSCNKQPFNDPPSPFDAAHVVCLVSTYRAAVGLDTAPSSSSTSPPASNRTRAGPSRQGQASANKDGHHPPELPARKFLSELKSILGKNGQAPVVALTSLDGCPHRSVDDCIGSFCDAVGLGRGEVVALDMVELKQFEALRHDPLDPRPSDLGDVVKETEVYIQPDRFVKLVQTIKAHALRFYEFRLGNKIPL